MRPDNDEYATIRYDLTDIPFVLEQPTHGKTPVDHKVFNVKEPADRSSSDSTLATWTRNSAGLAMITTTESTFWINPTNSFSAKERTAVPNLRSKRNGRAAPCDVFEHDGAYFGWCRETTSTLGPFHLYRAHDGALLEVGRLIPLQSLHSLGVRSWFPGVVFDFSDQLIDPIIMVTTGLNFFHRIDDRSREPIVFGSDE